MDEKRIAEIVLKVFKKAKEEHASHSRFALSNHVSDNSDLSSKTLERAYDRYINNKKKFGPPSAESVDLLCRYLSFEDYADYIKKNPTKKDNDSDEGPSEIVKEPARRNWAKTLVIAIGIISVVSVILNWPFDTKDVKSGSEKCMAWADSLYLEVSCSAQPFTQFGTKAEPLDPIKLQGFQKIEVNMATQFFADDGKPMIWYYKNQDGEIEYFTAPGLHPITGETLRKITPYIIETYVPIHSNNPDSFINQ
ncbi:MAG: hypothetical protein ABGX00_01170 [Allomuricauda sp.]